VPATPWLTRSRVSETCRKSAIAFTSSNCGENTYDAADSPIASNGCVAVRSLLDQSTRKQTEDVCLDAQGHPTRSAAVGAAIVRIKYDDHGNEIEKAYFGEDGKLRLEPDGYAFVRKKYDDLGNQIEEAYFGEDGKLRLGPDGCAIFRAKYDDYSKEIEDIYFDRDQKPCSPPAYGYAVVRAKYDDQGNLT
jgi:YD repeat-containing protein